MMHRTMLPALFLLAPLVWGADQDLLRRDPLQLSLKRAVEMAISPEGNYNIQEQEEAVKQAKSRSKEARAALLPDLESYVSETNEVRSLASLGLDSVKLPFNFHIPNVAGPYNVTDARFTAAGNAFNFSAIRRWQSARKAVHATQSEQDHATNEVSALVAKAYTAALRAEADLEAANADVVLAKALVTLAQNQKTSGTGTGIEVTRQKTKLADQTQHLLEAQNNQTKSHLQLLRAIGLRLDTQIELTDKLVFAPQEAITVEQAKADALKNREDFKAQQEQQDSVRLLSSAARYERLPVIQAFGDYGTIGQSNSALQPTRDYGIILKFPLFDGGRMDAQRGEQASHYREEKIKSNDLRQQIELEVREALDNLRSAEEQVRVSEAGLELANNVLTQARRRYEAGITNGLEITDAQTQLEHARTNRIAAVFAYNIARLDLGEATGTIRRLIQ